MASPALLTLRSARNDDRSRLANMLHFESRVHTHMDWRRPLDWLGYDPYLVVEKAGSVAAALAAPPDPPGVAWVRLFVASNRLGADEAWEMLWPAAVEQLAGKASNAVSIPIQNWFRELLLSSEFQHTHNVTVLDWTPSYPETGKARSELDTEIRKMTTSDLRAVCEVDNQGFPPLWQHSLQTIEFAFAQAALATVIEIEGKIVAYQISTLSPQGLHLARLAVRPEAQGKHLALSLVRHLQQEVSKLRDQRLTVNTQDTNKPSLGLYQRAGFKFTGEKLPVCEYVFG